MDRQDFMGLYESYMGVYEKNESCDDYEDVEKEEEGEKEEKKSEPKDKKDKAKDKKEMKESNDLYDLVLEYLLDEGLCESVENAEIMMAHMSEGWVESIVDEANEIMSITSPEGKRKKVNRTYPSGRANQNRQNHRKLAALQKRQALNPKAMSTRSARAQASDEVNTNLKKSINRLNAQPNVELKHLDYENPIDHTSSDSLSGYRQVPTDYRARRRRASGR